MKKIILQLAVSLDSFIEGPNGEYDWCFTDQDYGMSEFLNRIDTILFGRKSYELLLGLEEKPYPGKRKIVFSSSIKIEGQETKTISSDWQSTILNLKAAGGGDIWLFGGSELAASLLEAELIDELQLAVHPVVLGKGKPLFAGIRERIKLELTNSKVYESGLVQLFYKIKYKS